MEQPNDAARNRTIILTAVSEISLLLGRNCRERRAALKISQADLSARTGIAASHLSHIENGRGNPTLEVIELIAKALHCSVVPRIRIGGIAARERDDSCRPGQPCPAASGAAAVNALVNLFGGARGSVRFRGGAYDHVRVSAPAMRCLSTGRAGGNRTAAFCTLGDGRNLSCAMLATGTVLRWDRYWPRDQRCPTRRR